MWYSRDRFEAKGEVVGLIYVGFGMSFFGVVEGLRSQDGQSWRVVGHCAVGFLFGRDPFQLVPVEKWKVSAWATYRLPYWCAAPNPDLTWLMCQALSCL